MNLSLKGQGFSLRVLSLLVTLLLGVAHVSAQTVTGTVTDAASNTPLVGVSVLAAGSNSGA